MGMKVFLMLLFITTIARAQTNIGHIYGRVVDSGGKPISDASVVLAKSVVITKTNGEFSFEHLPLFSPLQLKINVNGYKSYKQTITLQLQMTASVAAASSSTTDVVKAMEGVNYILHAVDKDLGNIRLTADTMQLKNVTVTSSVKPSFKLEIDKKVFNVEKNIISAGGTALDAIRNVPSLQVDIDGNIKLRNAAPQIYIDGRPTTLHLDQLPADAVESVEVITNPSAKFDASGSAGILNVVLKRNKRSGYNANLTGGADNRGGFNGGGSANFRGEKFNISLTGMINQLKSVSDGTTGRLNYGDTLTNIQQQHHSKTDGGFAFARLGLDYFINNRTSVSIAGITVQGKFTPGEAIDINTDTLLASGNRSANSKRMTRGERLFDTKGFQFGFRHNFPKAGEELTADLTSFSGTNEGNSVFTTSYYNSSFVSGSQMQQVISDGRVHFLTIQMDYTKPFTEKAKIETGIRTQINSIANNTETLVQGIGSSLMVKVPAAANQYTNTYNVYAAYFSITGARKNFEYQLGLRAESSDYKGVLSNKGESFGNRYPFSLFPSVFLSRKLEKKQELQISITRRITRPTFFQLVPFIDFSDSLNITKGNPELRPEFIYSGELSYHKSFKGNNNILVSLYYKYTDRLITRYLDRSVNPVSGRPDLISSFVNANSGYSTGAEITMVNNVNRYLELTANLNIYTSGINTNSTGTVSQSDMLSWFAKLNANIKLPANWVIQLSGDYQSKTNLPVNNGANMYGIPVAQAPASAQGFTHPFWGVDMAVKKSFLSNNAASISLGVTDLFRTRRSDQHSESIYFSQDYYRLNNPQTVKLAFTYRFGKMDISLFKRQNTKTQAAAMQSSMENMQQ